MKRFLVAVAFGLMAIAAQAEASFDQIQTLIQQQNYAAAEKGLEVIIQNHPKSAKAFYAMAQVQAGLGNQDKAKKALDIATGLNPTLDFAPKSSVASLKDAITPQTSKIEAIEESHTVRNTILVLFLFGMAYVVYSIHRRNKESEEAYEAIKKADDVARAEREAERKRQHMEMLAKQDAERKAELAAEEALKAHKNYGKPGFDPTNPDKLKTKAQLKKEADEAARIEAEAEARRQRIRAEAAEEEARRARMNYSPAPAPTVVHTNSNDGLLTGVMIGSMMSHHNHSSHETTRVVEREVIREAPAQTTRDSSWDDTPSTPSRSSSWDDDSSSSRSSSSSSSSWSDSSSSSSSSSWDSGSSSSDSSSSWD